MAIMERLNLAALIAGGLSLALYVFLIVRQGPVGSGVEIVWVGAMITSFIVFLLVLIGLVSLAVIKDRKHIMEIDRLDDERDRDIERRGDAWSGHVMQVFAVVAIIGLMLGWAPVWIASSLYVGVIVSGGFGIVLRLIHYRTGV
ncbi:hypothetical protein RMQ97_11635 [Maricaulis sp. D1M11]|uniref:hypothetical protein n=1 Tax=Maricaulis sp. D1M11 TaxID=3076117 RepID=UPI0039B6BDC9